jgi:hypothetical protein
MTLRHFWAIVVAGLLTGPLAVSLDQSYKVVRVSRSGDHDTTGVQLLIMETKPVGQGWPD